MNNLPPGVNLQHENCYVCGQEVAPHDGMAFCSDECIKKFEAGHDEFPEEYDPCERDQSHE